jgi:cytidylate kinase
MLRRKRGQWIIAQQKWREKQLQGEATQITNPPVITISRQLGSGGAEIAQKLGRQLGWDVWDSEIIDRIANDANVSREMVEILDERRTSAFEKIARALSKNTSITSENYFRHLVSTLMSIGQQGKTIIVGRGANFILPEALNVRIIASLDLRLGTLMRRYNISQDEAESRIVKSDQGREGFIGKVFGADIDDIALYDLILRMDEFTIEDAIQIILEAVKIKFNCCNEGFWQLDWYDARKLKEGNTTHTYARNNTNRI